MGWISNSQKGESTMKNLTTRPGPKPPASNIEGCMPEVDPQPGTDPQPPGGGGGVDPENPGGGTGGGIGGGTDPIIEPEPPEGGGGSGGGGSGGGGNGGEGGGGSGGGSGGGGEGGNGGNGVDPMPPEGGIDPGDLKPITPERPTVIRRHMYCITCMYFAYDKGRTGECRRHAPTFEGWPIVKLNDWCGDHKISNKPVPYVPA